MSTVTTEPTIAGVIKLLNEGGWRLLGGKIARDEFRAEHRENLSAMSTAKIENNFFKDQRRIYVASASLDEHGGIVLRVYENRAPIQLEPGEGRVLPASALIEPKIELFDRRLKDYHSVRDGTIRLIEIQASFVERAQRKKSEGGGHKEVRQHVLALRFERR